jgi:choline transporter-like protein 2/4/5
LYLQVGLIIYWIAVTAMLYSAGDLTTNCRTPLDFKPFTFDVRSLRSWLSSHA